jgi:alkanesulfonate monooxygenase SsuD/methylene tetrahydromethanopterin reductase-like flavin-dependent oxidoreductase (luciferase family)
LELPVTTQRAVARLGDACNFVGTDIAETLHKLSVLRGHCEAAGRDFDKIEKTHVQAWLLGRNDAAVTAKRAAHERRSSREPSPGFVGTVFEAVDLIGRYRDAGIDLLILGDRNDGETRELFASDVLPHFA